MFLYMSTSQSMFFNSRDIIGLNHQDNAEEHSSLTTLLRLYILQHLREGFSFKDDRRSNGSENTEADVNLQEMGDLEIIRVFNSR